MDGNTQGMDLSNLPPELLERLKTLPPEERERLIMQLTQGYEGRGGLLNEQAARAQALRDTATPEGREAGGMYVAANPLEHLGAGLQRYKGYKDLQDVDERRTGLEEDKEEALRRLMRGYLG